MVDSFPDDNPLVFRVFRDNHVVGLGRVVFDKVADRPSKCRDRKRSPFYFGYLGDEDGAHVYVEWDDSQANLSDIGGGVYPDDVIYVGEDYPLLLTALRRKELIEINESEPHEEIIFPIDWIHGDARINALDQLQFKWTRHWF